MTISLSNKSVSVAARPNTIVGVLSESRGPVTSYSLLGNISGLFSISGNLLLTAWVNAPLPGGYNILVIARTSTFPWIDWETFTITVTPKNETGNFNPAGAIIR